MNFIDCHSYGVNFVLSQLKNCQLELLFDENQADKEDQVSTMKLQLYEMIKTFTKLLLNMEEIELHNEVGYWLVIAELLETQTLEDLDQEYLQSNDGVAPDNFFLFEESLKLIGRYLKKLSNWTHQTIQLFYFQILNLYYQYDTERTYQMIMTVFADKPQFQNIYAFGEVYRLPSIYLPTDSKKE